MDNADGDNDPSTGIGINLGSLDDVTSDTSGYRLKLSSTGQLFIWDGSNSEDLITVTDESKGSPSFSFLIISLL